jgi:cell division protein FtsL
MSRSYSSLLSWFALAIGASLMLYHTSDRVNALGHDLNTLNAQIETEQQSLHVLKAEWVYLANPARIEATAKRHLDLQPTAPSRVLALRDIGSLLPLHDGAEPAPQIEVAQTPAPAPVAAAPVLASAKAVRKNDRSIAAINAGHINDHMIMSHTAAVEASTDKIGMLINSLSLRP